MAVRHRSRENEYKEYTDNIINLMKEFNPRLSQDNIISQEPSLILEENPSILAFMNIDISIRDNNNVERNIDRIHIHIPYLLKIEYLKEYIKSAIVYTYFIDRDQGYSQVVVNECVLRSNIELSNEDRESEIPFSQFSNNIFGDIILLYNSGVGSGVIENSFHNNDINTFTKLCVITNDFRNEMSTQHHLLPGINFWYDLGSDVNRIPESEVLTQIDNNGNVRRNLLDEFNEVENTEPIAFREVQPTNLRQGECPVCYDKLEIGNYYNCSHGICCHCFNHWGESGHTTCPMCRSNVITENIVNYNYDIIDYEETIVIQNS